MFLCLIVKFRLCGKVVVFSVQPKFFWNRSRYWLFAAILPLLVAAYDSNGFSVSIEFDDVVKVIVIGLEYFLGGSTVFCLRV